VDIFSGGSPCIGVSGKNANRRFVGSLYEHELTGLVIHFRRWFRRLKTGQWKKDGKPRTTESRTISLP